MMISEIRDAITGDALAARPTRQLLGSFCTIFHDYRWQAVEVGRHDALLKVGTRIFGIFGLVGRFAPKSMRRTNQDLALLPAIAVTKVVSATGKLIAGRRTGVFYCGTQQEKP